MRIGGIIHQQICQIRWHLLACLGLIMVLPIEEAVVNFKAGGGFYSISLATAVFMFSPLLAGLIACANVQGDLDEKRYIFWRSKPANVKLLMTVKFFAGLIASLVVLACPVIFAFATLTLFAEERVELESLYSVPFFILIGIMTYSLCFACNVLVRRSARAWLIGILLAGLLLVIPFVLPLNLKDFVTDIIRYTLSYYLVIILGASVAAFAISLYATAHDWHLKTNLKELLWVGLGLLFVLMMLFSSQVANIKVLEEKEIESSWGQRALDSLDNRVIFDRHSFVDIGQHGISLRPIRSSGGSEGGMFPVHSNIGIDLEGRPTIYGPRVKGLRENIYPWHGHLYKAVDDQMYYFLMVAYYREEGKGSLHQRIYEKIYLRSYKLIGESWKPVNELDISDCVTDTTDIFRMAMRLVDDVIVACVNRSCVVVDVTVPDKLKRVDTKLDVLNKPDPYFPDREKEFAIPLLPVDSINYEERIKLSIDLNYQFHYGVGSELYKSSMVDINDGRISFFRVSQDFIARFDVTRYDEEKIYCKFTAIRPFTILESIGGLFIRDTLVKGGSLYFYGQGTLLVFDIRSGRKIRKLGHFVRMDYSVEDIEVLNDGNILLCLRWDRNLSPSDSDRSVRNYLCLLKNPS